MHARRRVQPYSFFSPLWGHTELLSNTLWGCTGGRGWPRQEAAATHQVSDELVHQLLRVPGSVTGRGGAGTARRVLPLGPGRPRRRGPARALQQALRQRQVPRGLLAAPGGHLGPPRPPLGSLGPPPLPQRLGLRQLLLPAPAELVQAVVVHGPRRRPSVSSSAVPGATGQSLRRKCPPRPETAAGCTRVPGGRPRPAAPLAPSPASGACGAPGRGQCREPGACRLSRLWLPPSADFASSTVSSFRHPSGNYYMPGAKNLALKSASPTLIPPKSLPSWGLHSRGWNHV